MNYFQLIPKIIYSQYKYFKNCNFLFLKQISNLESMADNKLTCEFCGLQYENLAALQNHQKRFCLNSDYGDIARLDHRLDQVKANKTDTISANPKEIQNFISQSHDFPGGQTTQATMNNPYGPRTPASRNYNAQTSGVNYGEPLSLEQQAEQFKVNRAGQRQQAQNEEQDVMSMLRYLGERKERDLKAQIEQEEIQRTIKTADRNNLGALQNNRQQELMQLAKQRQGVHQQEQSLMDEISRMENDLITKETNLNKQRQMNDSSSLPSNPIAKQKLQQQEQQWAQERAAKVAQIKMERDRLENQRGDILNQLSRIQNGQSPSKLGRDKGIFQRSGSALALNKPPSGIVRGGLEPSIKEKLVQDQVRINQLKQDQYSQQQKYQAYTGFDDVDVLEREMKNQAGYHDQMKGMVNEFGGRDTPNKQRYLGAIQDKLQRESAAPSSLPHKPSTKMGMKPPRPQYSAARVNNTVDNGGVMDRLNDLEGLLLQQSAQPQDHNRQEFPPQNNYYPQNPAQTNFSAPQVGVRNPFQSNPQQSYHPLVPPQTQFDPNTQQNPWMQPVTGFPNQTMDSAYSADPAMNQLAQILQSQNQENQKLREVLEQFGKNTAPADELENFIKGSSNQIQQLGGMPGALGTPQNVPLDPNFAKNGEHMTELNTTGRNMGGLTTMALPDEFAFRQNEQRAEDLEVEERALMNLAAQEYDQLRVVQKLPKDSELYNHKLRQYKELSAMRAEVEKVLQEQRLEKIKRDFEKQKIDEEREIRQQQWMENQKMAVLEGRIGKIGDQPQMPQTQRPNLVQARNQTILEPEEMFEQPNKVNDIEFENLDPEQLVPQQALNAAAPQTSQMMVIAQLDIMFGLPRTIRQCQVVYHVIQNQNVRGQNFRAGPNNAEADHRNNQLNKVYFDSKDLLPNLPSYKNCKIIFEVQAVDPAQSTGFSVLGWSWFDILHEGTDVLATGKWRLPIYLGQTSADMAYQGAKGLRPQPGVTLCLRVGAPSDQIFMQKADHLTTEQHYEIPRYHTGQIQEPLYNQKQPAPQQQAAPVQAPPGSKYDPNHRCEGVRIKPYFMINYPQAARFTLRATMYRGAKGAQDIMKYPNGEKVSDKFKIAVANQDEIVEIPDTTYVYINNQLEYTLAPYNENIQGTKIKAKGLIRSLDTIDVTMKMDFHREYWAQKPQQAMYMLIETFTDNNGKQELVGYSVMELCHRETGQVRYGVHQLDVRLPPILFKEAGAPVGGAYMFIQLVDPIINPNRNLPRKQDPINVQNQQQDPVPPADVGQPPNTAISEQFIPNRGQAHEDKAQWDPKDGVDIYFDGCRHLPDNCTITRLVIKIVDVNLKDQHPKTQFMAIIDKSTLKRQHYGEKIEIRKPLAKSSLVYIKIETLDIGTGLGAIVGFSWFPLFMNINNQMPAESEQPKVRLLQGNYQMPILAQKVKEQQPFSYVRFFSLERVPTATILLRVHKAQKNAQGKVLSVGDFPPEERSKAFIECPLYNDGVYRNDYLSLATDETKIMDLRRRRPDPKLMEVVDVLLESSGLSPQSMNTKQINDYILGIIDTNDKSPMLDMDFSSQYEPSIGFMVKANALHNVKDKGFFCILSSILPPAAYYDPQVGMDKSNTFTLSEPNFTSNQFTYEFKDPEILVLNAKPQADAMSIFFDVKWYNLETDEFEDYGFTLCPIIQALETDLDEATKEFYVISGIFNLPLIKGKLEFPQLQRLMQTETPLKELKAMIKDGEVKYLNQTSLVVKLIDAQRRMHFHKSNWADYQTESPQIMNKYLEQDQIKTYAYKPLKGGKTLESMIPKKHAGNKKAFYKELKAKFRSFVQI